MRFGNEMKRTFPKDCFSREREREKVINGLQQFSFSLSFKAFLFFHLLRLLIFQLTEKLNSQQDDVQKKKHMRLANQASHVPLPSLSSSLTENDGKRGWTHS